MLRSSHDACGCSTQTTSTISTSAKCFFAMHPWPGLSDVVQRVGAGEKQPMLAINGLTGLMSFVQAGVAEFHPWGCRAGHLEQPDRLIFDLDPGEDAPWEAVIEGGERAA